MSSGPGETNEGTVALKCVKNLVERLKGPFACVQVAGDSVTVGVKKATHSRGAAESQRQVAWAGNRQGGTHIRNILFSPGYPCRSGYAQSDREDSRDPQKHSGLA
jgi:hypothetical protein